VRELRVLGDRLTEVTGRRPDADDWAEALEVEEAADAAIADLYAQRADLPLTDREFYTLVRSREYLLAEDVVAVAASIPTGPAVQHGLGLVLSGILAEPLDLFDRLDDAGAHVAADDLSTGTRRLLPPSDLTDPYERLADRLLRGPADPTRTDPVAARVARLLELLQASGARGVLVYDPTFCEPELFYVPLLREHLAAAGYPLLHVEVEPGTPLPTQTVTRIEAFVETLS
jgi:benzoyl-CoA reductase/2-hydroxyglutaryl-CoA dehydratase subunit BcrC/BadD/HgdB